MKYGPKTAEIEELIEKVRNLTEDEAERLDAAWEAVWGTDRYDGWDVVWNVVWSAYLDSALADVWDAAWDAVRDAAWDAVWDAVLALLVKDLISPEHFNILYGPWASVMEKSQL